MPIFFHSKATNFGPVNPERFQVGSLNELFTHLVDVVARIPEQSRHDYYYSLAQTDEPRKKDEDDEEDGTWARKFWREQEALAFDIDHLEESDLPKITDYGDAVAEILKIPPEEMTINVSGHGIHFLVFLEEPIKDWEFFRKLKPFYVEVLSKIEKILKTKSLSGSFDRNIFDHGRIFRLPGTENRKYEPYKKCQNVQLSLKKHAIDLAGLAGIAFAKEKEQLSELETKRALKTIDQKTILTDCEIIKWAKEKGPEVKEPTGYKLLSILARLPDERKTAHEFYKGWTGSSSLMATDPDKKMDQAVNASRPALCKTLELLTPENAENCRKCRHFGKIKSPISIRGPDFIATQGLGFRNSLFDKEGKARSGKGHINHDDLLKLYTEQTQYFYAAHNRDIHIYTGTHYITASEDLVRSFVEDRVNPKPSATERNEFLAKVRANHIKDEREVERFFYQSTLGLVNLQNGIFDIRRQTLLPHSKQYGFQSILPYAYDPGAECPKFKKFLHEVTLGRKELEQTLIEFLAYSIWPGYEDHMFLWLTGTGRNGKSTYMEILKAMVGEHNAKNFLIHQFIKDQNVVAELSNMMLNLCEEGDIQKIPREFLGTLKNLSGNGQLDAPRKYKGTLKFRNRAKMVFASNDLPVLEGVQDAIKSRFVIIPFDLRLEDHFTQTTLMNEGLLAELFEELPGILNLALATLKGMCDRPKFRIYRGGTEAREVWNEVLKSSDNVEAWLQEHVLLDPQAPLLSGAQLHAHYLSVTNEDYQVKNVAWFIRKLKAKLGPRLVAHREAEERLYGGLRFKRAQKKPIY